MGGRKISDQALTPAQKYALRQSHAGKQYRLLARFVSTIRLVVDHELVSVEDCLSFSHSGRRAVVHQLLYEAMQPIWACQYFPLVFRVQYGRKHFVKRSRDGGPLFGSLVLINTEVAT